MEEGAARSVALPRLRWLPRLAVDMDLSRITLQPSGREPHPSTEDFMVLWRRCVEDMELLALAWLVDPHAWRELIDAHNPDSIRGGLRTNDITMPTYLIQLPRPDVTAHEQMWGFLEAVFAPINDSERSVEFRQAKATLLAQEGRESVLVAAENLQITVELVYRSHPENLHATILDWLEATRDRPRRCKVAGLGQFNPTTITRQTMARIHAQVQRGLVVGDAVIGLLGTKDAWTPHATNQFFTDLLGEYGAKRLRIRHLGRRRWAMEAFFSKLIERAASEATETGRLSVVTLRIDGFQFGDSVAKRRSALLWWFYGLFSQDACHSIHKMEFPLLGQCLPCLGDMLWFVEVLQTHGAPRPELFVVDAFEDHVASEEPFEDQWAIVPCGYPIHVHAVENSLNNQLVFDNRQTRFRVFRDDPRLDFLDVLVPGYGHCRIRRSEAVKVEKKTLTPWTLDQHSIQSMAFGLLDLGDSELSRLHTLLGLIGRPVRTLRLTRDTAIVTEALGSLDADFLQDLIRRCPRLETLSLEAVPVANADALVGLYEHDECGIKALDLSDRVFGDRRSLLTLVDALGRSTLRISRTLESLALDFTRNNAAGDQDDDDALVLAVFAMLEANQFLRSVHIHVSQRHLARYASRFRMLRETKIHAQKAPVPLRAKHALISVLGKRHTLGQDVLSVVFDFAAECETRKVSTATPYY